MVRTDTITGPAFWSSALIEGKPVPNVELEAYNAFVAKLATDGWRVVRIARGDDGQPQKPRFTWSLKYYGGIHDGGDVIDYMIQKANP